MTTNQDGVPFPPFPPTAPFPQSLVSSTGHGPDFPGSAGDRELGKFRPAATPRLTRIATAVEDANGNSLMELLAVLVDNQQEMLRELKLLRLGFAMAENNVMEWIEAADGNDDFDAVT